MKNVSLCSIVGFSIAFSSACSTNDDSIRTGFGGRQGGQGGAVSTTDGTNTATGGMSVQSGSGGSFLAQQGGAGAARSAGAVGVGGRAGSGGATFVPQQGGASDAAAPDAAGTGGSIRDAGGFAGSAGLGGKAGAGGSAGAATTAANGGAAKGVFPRADADPSLQSVSGTGPYQYQSYSTGFPIAGSAFASATIFYPTSAEPPFAAIAFCPGFTEVEAGFLTWGELLASHGIAALILTPQNTFTDLPELRGDQLLAALDTLVAESSRAGGPLNGKVATDRLGVMGHSMGGGGTLFACNKGSDRIKAAVPLMPWQPLGTFPACTAPTLVVAAENDALVNPDSMAYPEYQSLASTDKAYMNVAGADHVAANDVSGGNNLYARYALSWLKLYLESDSRYAQFLSGNPHKADVAANLFVKYEP